MSLIEIKVPDIGDFSDVAVIELLFIDGPLPRLRVCQNGVADGVDSLAERRCVVAPLFRHFRLGFGRFGNAQVAHVVDSDAQRAKHVSVPTVGCAPERGRRADGRVSARRDPGYHARTRINPKDTTP